MSDRLGLQEGNTRYRSSPRASHIILEVRDPTGLQEQALEWVVNNHPKWGDAKEVHFGPWDRMATYEKGEQLYVLCEEGVGTEVTDEEPFELPVYSKKDGFISLMPCATLTLRPEDVRDLPVVAEVNLANFIRVFGSRLEENFNLWNRTLA